MNDNIAGAIGLKQIERKALIACSLWGLVTLLVFGLGLMQQPRSDMYVIAISLLKIGSFLIAAVLCWRNARNPDILSGQTVWQAIAAGMTFYALGDITVILWRSLWGATSIVALGDVFYGASYIFLAIGLLQAIIPRQTNLSLSQTLGISVAGVVGIVFASWINFYTPQLAVADAVLPEAQATQTVTVETGSVESKAAAAGAVAKGAQAVPPLARTINNRLSGIASRMGLVYVVGDCAVVIMAIALLIAFWGGSYSETWKLVALAGLCLYVADMFLIYEMGKGTYQQGQFWEIFWVLSALCFGLGAGVEQGVSERAKQRSHRKQWL
ncbi:MAG: hypothetical protein AAFN40_21675 [Cyanobacteria bacterium J06560_6]